MTARQVIERLKEFRSREVDAIHTKCRNDTAGGDAADRWRRFDAELANHREVLSLLSRLADLLTEMDERRRA